MSDETDHPKIKLVDTPWGKAPKFTGALRSVVHAGATTLARRISPALKPLLKLHDAWLFQTSLPGHTQGFSHTLGRIGQDGCTPRVGGPEPLAIQDDAIGQHQHA